MVIAPIFAWRSANSYNSELRQKMRLPEIQISVMPIYLQSNMTLAPTIRWTF